MIAGKRSDWLLLNNLFGHENPNLNRFGKLKIFLTIQQNLLVCLPNRYSNLPNKRAAHLFISGGHFLPSHPY